MLVEGGGGTGGSSEDGDGGSSGRGKEGQGGGGGSGVYPGQVHAQFELRQQVEDDAALVVQDAQVFLFIVLRVRHLLRRADVIQPSVLLTKSEKEENLLKRPFYTLRPASSAFQRRWRRKREK